MIHDAPHTAILLSGNNHVIEGNDIHSVTLETGDVGAFYMGRDWTARGNLLRHNLIHNLGNDDTNGIYLDDCASGTHVFGNILFRAAREVHVGGGRDNLIENNIFIDPRPAAVKFDARATGWAKGMIEGPNPTLMDRLQAMPYQEPPWSQYYPALVNILNDDPALPKGNVVRRNVFYLGQPLQFMDNTQGLVAIYDNLTGVDPGSIALGRRRASTGSCGPTSDLLRSGPFLCTRDIGRPGKRKNRSPSSPRQQRRRGRWGRGKTSGCHLPLHLTSC